MRRESAVNRHTKEALFGTKVFIAVEAIGTLATADPRKHRLLLADEILRDFRADFVDNAGDLVAEREGQVHATRGIEAFAAAEIGVAVLNVQIGMAQAAAFDPHQHFLALRLRGLDDGLAQRRVEFNQRLSTHLRHGDISL